MKLRLKKSSKKDYEENSELEELQRKEGRALINIRRKMGYDVEDYYVKKKDKEILADLRLNFTEMAKKGETQKAYEKIREYVQTVCEKSEIAKETIDDFIDDDFDEYNEFDDVNNCRETMIERIALEVEYELYKDIKLDKNINKLYNGEEFERFKRGEKYKILSTREENKQYTTYIREEDLINLTKMYLDCINLMLKNDKKMLHNNIKEYTTKVGIVVGNYSEKELNRDYVKQSIMENTTKEEENLYNTLEHTIKDKKKNGKRAKIKRLLKKDNLKDKNKNKEKTNRCCMIM